MRTSCTNIQQMKYENYPVISDPVIEVQSNPVTNKIYLFSPYFDLHYKKKRINDVISMELLILVHAEM